VGGATGPLAALAFIFSGQAVALTVVRHGITITGITIIYINLHTRSLYATARDIASRLVVTFLYYGFETTVRQEGCKLWSRFHISKLKGIAPATNYQED
jgi:hypothetical protein